MNIPEQYLLPSHSFGKCHTRQIMECEICHNLVSTFFPIEKETDINLNCGRTMQLSWLLIAYGPSGREIKI